MTRETLASLRERITEVEKQAKKQAKKDERERVSIVADLTARIYEKEAELLEQQETILGLESINESLGDQKESLEQELDEVREELSEASATRDEYDEERDRERSRADEEEGNALYWKDEYESKSASLEETESELEDLRNPALTTDQDRLYSAAVSLNLDPALLPTFREILTDRSMQGMLLDLMDREGEKDLKKVVLQGIGMNPAARQHFNEALDRTWLQRESEFGYMANVGAAILGSGLHAAIFASVYHQRTGLKPLVIEKTGRVGGTFALSLEPSFYLNSRNRPGPLSVPGDEFGSLNVLPGSIIQPADMGGLDYLTNTSLNWVIRTMLARHAIVFRGVEVQLDFGDSWVTANGNVAPGRKVMATGLGNPGEAFATGFNDRYMPYGKFMSMMDSPWPLKGMRRVAVIGAGDSGRTAIEALTGQGPMGDSSLTLDYVEKIDWYGVPGDQQTREGWESCNRSRYLPIGRLLPSSNTDRPFRVSAFARATYGVNGYDCFKVDGMPYDYVIDCTGFVPQFDREEYEEAAGRVVGGKAFGASVIGPAAQLNTENGETIGREENRVAIFRYADRTAMLAREF